MHNNNCQFYDSPFAFKYIVIIIIIWFQRWFWIRHVMYMGVWFVAVPELWVFTINWIKQKRKKHIVHSLRPSMISGFCHGVSEVFTFLECSAALVGSYWRFETGCWYQNVGNNQHCVTSQKSEDLIEASCWFCTCVV